MKATTIQSHSFHNLQSQLGQRNTASCLSGFCTMSLLKSHGHPIDYPIHCKKISAALSSDLGKVTKTVYQQKQTPWMFKLNNPEKIKILNHRQSTNSLASNFNKTNQP